MPRNNRARPAFLRGPIPMPWLERAAACPGAALAVAVALWFRQGLHPASVTVAVSLADLALGGAKPAAVRRGLAALAAAGLIHVARPLGCKLQVTIRDR